MFTDRVVAVGGVARKRDADAGARGAFRNNTGPEIFFTMDGQDRSKAMSANGLPVFDKTLQTTNIWLDELMERLGPDRQLAWKVLSTVLHKLRDMLPVEASAHLGAQLPLLVRGAYYDQYQPAHQPQPCRHGDEFVAEVNEWLQDARPVDPKEAIAAVFEVLSLNIDQEQVAKIKAVLPEPIRRMWADAEEPV